MGSDLYCASSLSGCWAAGRARRERWKQDRGTAENQTVNERVPKTREHLSVPEEFHGGIRANSCSLTYVERLTIPNRSQPLSRGVTRRYTTAAGKIIPLTAALKSLDTVHITAAFSLILSFTQTQALQEFLIDFNRHKKNLICSSARPVGGGAALAS